MIAAVAYGIGGIVERACGAVLVPESAQACRSALASSPEDVIALLGRSMGDVGQLNLAAAVHADTPRREIVLAADEFGGSFLSKAAQLGIDRVLPEREVVELAASLATEEGAPFPAPAPYLDPARASYPDPATAPATDPATAEESVVQSPAPAASQSYRNRSACSRAAARGHSRRPASSGASTARSGTGIAFLSGRGGVGKSTLSLLCGLTAVRMGLRCAVVDMDVQFGDLRFACERDDAVSVHALREGDALPPAPDDGKLGLYCADYGPEYSELSARVLLSAMKRLMERNDLVIANTGAGWMELHADAVDLCDSAVMVMDQRSTSIAGCKRACELCVRLGIPTSKISYMLNRCSPKTKVSSYDCALTLGADRVIEISDGGQGVEEAIALGVPSSLLDSGNPAIRCVQDAVAELVPAASEAQTARHRASHDARQSKPFLRKGKKHVSSR